MCAYINEVVRVQKRHCVWIQLFLFQQLFRQSLLMKQKSLLLDNIYTNTKHVYLYTSESFMNHTWQALKQRAKWTRTQNEPLSCLRCTASDKSDERAVSLLRASSVFFLVKYLLSMLAWPYRVRWACRENILNRQFKVHCCCTSAREEPFLLSDSPARVCRAASWGDREPAGSWTAAGELLLAETGASLACLSPCTNGTGSRQSSSKRRGFK